MKRTQFRQGDVLLEPIAPVRWSTPVEPRPSAVLFTGERTGHSHRLVGEVRVYDDGLSGFCFEVGAGGGELVHEEHRPIPLQPGWYRAWRQREYVPGGQRTLAD